MTFYLQTYPFGFAQDNPYRRMARRWAENNEHTLGINIREEDDAYILSALVPGIKADDLNIQVLEDVVRIEGEYKRSSPVDKVEENSISARTPHGSFTRTLRLPVRHRRGSRRSADHGWCVDAETAQGRICPPEADQDHSPDKNSDYSR